MSGGYNNGFSYRPYNVPPMDMNRGGFRSPPQPNYSNMRFSNNRSPRYSPQNYRSPVNSPTFRNDQPFHSTPTQSHNSSFNEQWSIQANMSFGSNTSSSGSFRSDVSYGSPYNSRHSAGNYKGRRQYSQSPASNESNPGHSPDIRKYVKRSMLDDPWKELMENIKQNEQT